MAQTEPDSVTLFFRKSANIQRLSIGQLCRLSALQAEIDALNAQNLSDFNLTYRDVQVGHLREQMSTLVEGAMVDSRSVDEPAVADSTEPVAPRHMAFTQGRHFG